MLPKNHIQTFIFSTILLLLLGCKKTNWIENYREREKSPFGLYILKNEVNTLFKDEEVIFLKQHFYDYLYENYDVTSEDFGNYICIKNAPYKFSKESIDDLLSFVSDGNTAFLAFNNFSDELQKALEITTKNLDKLIFSNSELKKRSGTFYLQDSNFINTDFSFDRNIKRHYIVTYNEEKTTVLGTHQIDAEKLPNFIRIQFGKGFVYVHTNPVVFTNYFLLKDKFEYTEHVFSYLPSSILFWDPQIANSKYLKNIDKDKSSVFSFFLQHQSLTWFLFTMLAGLLLFFLFNAKRKQRAIPVIPAPENTTVAFTQTIASLYLKEANHKNLVDKKITYFLEKVRTKYLLKTDNLNKDFIEKLALKSGNNYSNTNYLVNTIITLHKKSECSEEELVVLHKMIDNFFKNNTNGNT